MSATGRKDVPRIMTRDDLLRGLDRKTAPHGSGHGGVPSGTVAFEVRLARSGSDLLMRELDLLRWSVGITLRERPVEVLAWVVLPDRMHAIWSLPDGDSAHALRWGAIKARFATGLRQAGQDRQDPGDADGDIWEPGLRERAILDAGDLRRQMLACRDAPVAAGLVARWQDWRVGSFTRGRLRAAG